LEAFAAQLGKLTAMIGPLVKQDDEIGFIRFQNSLGEMIKRIRRYLRNHQTYPFRKKDRQVLMSRFQRISFKSGGDRAFLLEKMRNLIAVAGRLNDEFHQAMARTISVKPSTDSLKISLQQKDKSGETTRSEMREIVEAVIGLESADEGLAGRLSAYLNRQKEAGQTPEEIKAELQKQLDEWITEHREFIFRNKQTIVDALMVLEEGLQDNLLAVTEVLKRFGLRVDISGDLDVRGFAKSVAVIFKEVENNIRSMRQDVGANPRVRPLEDKGPTQGAAPTMEDVTMVREIFNAFAAVNQKTTIRYEIPARGKGAENRAEQLELLLGAVEDSILINGRFEVQLVAFDLKEEGELRSLIGRLRREKKMALDPEKISVMNRKDLINGTPSIWITEEVVERLAHGKDVLDSGKYADGLPISYSGAENFGTMAEVYAAGLAAAALSQDTADLLARQDQVARIRSEAALLGLSLLVNFLAERARNAAFAKSA
jgi:hypothetical protein